MSRLIDEARAIESLGSLAQATRLSALRHLLEAHPNSLPAGEIAKRCAVPHNTMSTHLGVLNRAGLIAVERAGRSMNYCVDLSGYRGLLRFLMQDCCAGRADLCADVTRLISEDKSAFANPEEVSVTASFNVLFLCTHNSARSIMAEALLTRIGRGRFNAYSAGSEPADRPMPEVIERLKKLGHDTGMLRCKSWNEFMGPTAPRMDFVIALCDTPQGQSCPDFGDKAMTGAWPLPDPAQFIGSAAEHTALLNELYGMIRRRLEIFTSLPFESLNKMALKARLDEIGDTSRIVS
jgi:ArsR family transcriptional regulator, arsenate/arsenite/antimonite-responsive transcriptional repressor / arsenate reductase (thioredoxin)